MGEISENLKKLTNEIRVSFSFNDPENNNKWMLLNVYRSEYLSKDIDLSASYISVLSTLINSLHPSLFQEKWRENLFDNVFLHGIPHQSFLILVERLDSSEQYVKQKIINLLEKFMQLENLGCLFKYQCVSSAHWNLKYIAQTNAWDQLITALVSLPDRIANGIEGMDLKVFHPTYYMPLLFSTVVKVLHVLYRRLQNSQDCSLEFLAKLTGRLCMLGQAGIVAKIYLEEIFNLLKSDYLWRRISQNFICKLPFNSLDSFITNLLLEIKWYGHVEWIIGDKGVKNERINRIMTGKLLFSHTFKNVIVLQNAIGYFASSAHRDSVLIKILNSLLEAWTDATTLKYQNKEKQLYIASAMMICAGWIIQLQLELDKKYYIAKILMGCEVRLRNPDLQTQTIGMFVSTNLIQAVDCESRGLEAEFPDAEYLFKLYDLMDIPSKPKASIISFDDVRHFKETQQLIEREKTLKENEKPVEKVDNKLDRSFEDVRQFKETQQLVEGDKTLKENEKPLENVDNELDSDDELEPYDLSNDVPGGKRPLYLRDCMKGLIQQEDVEWNQNCLIDAEKLIKANPYATEEVAEEMANILLHLTDHSLMSNFIGLRKKTLISLTVQCPLVVVSFLTSQFAASNYSIAQRLDILEVLAASSTLLSFSHLPENSSLSSVKEMATKMEPDWQIIIAQRHKQKTKRNTTSQELPLTENKFSAIAGNFFYPLLNSYERVCKILKLEEDHSYVLGRFIYTLGIIMSSAQNTTHCSQMGSSLLQFLYSVSEHKDVFVRKAIIFSVGTTILAIPSSILFSEMSPDVTKMKEWLQNVAETDFEPECIEKALIVLSCFNSVVPENSLVGELKRLVIAAE